MAMGTASGMSHDEGQTQCIAIGAVHIWPGRSTGSGSLGHGCYAADCW